MNNNTTCRKDSILLLALGNDILGDDGAAIEAAKILKEYFEEQIQIQIVFGNGLELLDFLEGRDKVLILDSISTNRYPVGSVIEFSIEDFSSLIGVSPHYMGLPEALFLGKTLELDFPQTIKILAMEIQPQFEIKIGLSEKIQLALPQLIKSASEILSDWLTLQPIYDNILCDCSHH